MSKSRSTTNRSRKDGIELPPRIMVQGLRSPLHPEALGIDDLKVGLKITRYHRGHPDYSPRATATVNGRPFKYGDKYGSDSDQAHVWMIPALILITYGGEDKTIQQNWFLADMGVVPYEGLDGRFLGWNPMNYTLATS